jgi:serine/threonine protein kinase
VKVFMMSPGVGRQCWLGGRYALGEIIGKGGMSTVYRAYDHHMARDVAVKVFDAGPELSDADERFRREVMVLAGLRDPGIVTVFDAELDVAVPYLVTELVTGPPLSQRIRRMPLSEAQAIHLGAALARTLGYVHAHGIVHRDVKPSNILLQSLAEDPFTAPKLVDFGIAIAADATRLTAVNLTLGTANYLSPEQVRAERLTPATDVYSLGLVLIEALTGQPAYPGTGLEATMSRLDRPPAVPAVTSVTLRAALTDMTATDPQDRPAAAEVARRLDELDGSRTTRLPRGDAAASAALLGKTAVRIAGRAHRRPRRSHPIAPAALVIAALAGVAAAAGVITHQPDHPANQAPPGYAAPTTGSSPAPTHPATARTRTPTSASAGQQVAYPASSTAVATTQSRRPATTSSQHATPPKTPSTSKASPSTTPTSTSASPSTTPSGPSSPSTPETASDPDSPSTSATTSPPPSPTP